MSTLMFEYDISKHIKVRSDPLPFQEFTGGVVKLAINDKVMDAMEASKDRDLGAARIVAEAQKACEATTRDVDKLLGDYQSKYRKVESKQERFKLSVTCVNGVKKAIDQLKRELHSLPEVQWKKFLAKHGKAKEEYKNYKVGCRGREPSSGVFAVSRLAAFSESV